MRSRPDAALLLDLMAAMFEAGVSIDHALELLSRLHPDTVGPPLGRVVGARRLGADWPAAVALATNAAHAGSRGRGDRVTLAVIGPLLEAVVFAATTGAPSAALLRSRAVDLRGSRRQETERRAASLGVRLVLPLGLCQLPAFLCLGVVPVVLALLPALGS
ncbi:type II secretion system F family protein [Tersicoccus solisilvae]|uniref:type II secretion system F family protein n=1 Tax=Tersicoccus solisilvae TaxID=1882339 RepID=UPI00166C3E78|nr:type II secretion system F family protein [Tersicoccus solisilvae]